MLCCMGASAHTVSCLGRGVCEVLRNPGKQGLFARLGAGMRWGAQTADALAWLLGWLTCEVLETLVRRVVCAAGGWHADRGRAGLAAGLADAKPWHAGLFARLAAGMRWGAHTADALAWLPGWLAREPGLLARLAAEASALLPALAACFLHTAGDRLPSHSLDPGARLQQSVHERPVRAAFVQAPLQLHGCCSTLPLAI